MKVAILTDTNSGISKEEAENIGIHVMPMPVLIDGEVFFEGDNLTEEEFYEALTSGKDVSTSQPSPADVLDTWEDLFGMGYNQIVYIPMSSGLSGSCKTAKGLAQEYEGKVYVVDNHRISVTMRASVIKAKKYADQGCDGKAICKKLEKDAYNATIYVSVNTLEFLRKGGRITPAAAAIGTVLKIKPVLSIQGEKLDSYATVRGTMKKCEQKMISACKNDLMNRFPGIRPDQLHVGGVGARLNQEEIAQWVEMLEMNFPGVDLFFNPLSASISTHTGPGAVGIGISIDMD
ncbi:MAG: DegV family protein [Roseburia sp.]